MYLNLINGWIQTCMKEMVGSNHKIHHLQATCTFPTMAFLLSSILYSLTHRAKHVLPTDATSLYMHQETPTLSSKTGHRGPAHFCTCVIFYMHVHYIYAHGTAIYNLRTMIRMRIVLLLHMHTSISRLRQSYALQCFSLYTSDCHNHMVHHFTHINFTPLGQVSLDQTLVWTYNWAFDHSSQTGSLLHVQWFKITCILMILIAIVWPF